jgi:hypothetical protein
MIRCVVSMTAIHIDFKMLRQGINQIDPEVKNIINVGSVGQPRDGNSDAKYVIFDDADFTVDLRYVKYDIDKTADLLAKKNFRNTMLNGCIRIGLSDPEYQKCAESF